MHKFFYNFLDAGNKIKFCYIILTKALGCGTFNLSHFHNLYFCNDKIDWTNFANFDMCIIIKIRRAFCLSHVVYSKSAEAYFPYMIDF